MDDGDLDDALRERLRAGDEQAFAEAFGRHRERLWRTVHFRLDSRLAGRIDPDDVLQEAYLDAMRRVSSFLVLRESTTFFVWLRMVVSQTMVDLHRRHVGAAMRAAGKEVALETMVSPATSLAIAAQLAASATSPSQQAARAELIQLVDVTLQQMEPIDREVLVLRHFEELTNSEVAEVLGIQQKAASIRYFRALARLKEALAGIPGFFE